jgi:organic radical activating enzyme
MKNLSLYFSRQDYEELKGPDWPSYDDFLLGHRGTNPEIQEEIEEFVNMLVKDGIKFPIRTKTACQSKWTWSTIWLNQLSTSSCHRVNPIKMELDSFDNFHNLPGKIKDRQLMLEGQWPTGGCEYCKKIEEAGGHSDRLHNLEIRDLTPPEMEINPTATHVTPRIVEIFAQNTCNFSCIYCNGNLSSKIEQENKKFGAFEKNGVSIPVVTVPTSATKEYFDKFLSWLENNISALKRLHLLGGETFIQHELMENVLKIISRSPNPDLVLNIFSNLNVPDRHWNYYISYIKDLCQQGHLKQFDLTASIDCWGEESQYTRFGLDLEKFEKNFAWLADQDESWLTLNVNQTITATTIRSMPALNEKIKQYSRNRHIGQYFEFYIGPNQFHHPSIFSWDTWKNDFENIFATMPRDTARHQEAVLRMTGIKKQLEKVTKNNDIEIKKLHVYLDELDRRRGTDWRSVFPYLNIVS